MKSSNLRCWYSQEGERMGHFLPEKRLLGLGELCISWAPPTVSLFSPPWSVDQVLEPFPWGLPLGWGLNLIDVGMLSQSHRQLLSQWRHSDRLGGKRNIQGWWQTSLQLSGCRWPKSWPTLPTKAKRKVKRQRLEEIERWLLFSAGGRGEHSRVTPQDLCPHLHGKSRGFYKAGIQESAMRTEADRILIPSSCIVSKAVINWQQ